MSDVEDEVYRWIGVQQRREGHEHYGGQIQNEGIVMPMMSYRRLGPISVRLMCLRGSV